MRVPFFAANWKMNKTASEVAPFFKELAEKLKTLPKKVGQDFQVVVAPQAPHLLIASEASQNSLIHIGAQNCGHTRSGAFTGEVSPAVLKEMGCSWVILGHSERRHLYLEDDKRVLGRLTGALTEGVGAILCVGETLAERKAHQTMKVIETQLQVLKDLPKDLVDKTWVLAYEPVWAIGTGENATPEQAQEVHAHIRGWLKTQFSASLSEKTRILYGGSVKPDNSKALMAQTDVDGFLVGGASLEAKSFGDIIENALKSRG